jgi:hypothetical protein
MDIPVPIKLAFTLLAGFKERPPLILRFCKSSARKLKKYTYKEDYELYIILTALFNLNFVSIRPFKDHTKIEQASCYQFQKKFSFFSCWAK